MKKVVIIFILSVFILSSCTKEEHYETINKRDTPVRIDCSYEYGLPDYWNPYYRAGFIVLLQKKNIKTNVFEDKYCGVFNYVGALHGYVEEGTYNCICLETNDDYFYAERSDIIELCDYNNTYYIVNKIISEMDNSTYVKYKGKCDSIVISGDDVVSIPILLKEHKVK